EEENAAETAEDSNLDAPLLSSQLQDARDLERRRRIFELHRTGGWNLASDAREEPWLHRVSRERWVILNDDGNVVGSRDLGEVSDDGVRIDLGHPRRADHHARRAGVSCMPRVLHADLQAVRCGTRDDRDTAIDVLH